MGLTRGMKIGKGTKVGTFDEADVYLATAH